MSELTTQLSLNELIRLGVHFEVRILSGRSGLTRPVAWVNALSSMHVRDYQPTTAELILLMPPYLDLITTCGWLKQTKAVGVALAASDLPSEPVNWAEADEFPILAVPSKEDLQQMQRRLVTLLVDIEAGVTARKAEIYQHLTRLLLENRGIEAIANALHDLTGKEILVQDKRLQVLASFAPTERSATWTATLEWLTRPENLPKEILDRKKAVEFSKPIQQSLMDMGMRLVVPIIVNNMARGYLSLVHSGERFDRLDQIALEQGAAACALEMAKVKAVSEARKRLIGDLIEAVLSGSVDEVDAARWADRAGYRRTGPHTAAVMQWASTDAPTLRRLETIVSGEVKRVRSSARALAREREIVVFYALHPERGLWDAQQWARRVYDLAQSEFPQAHLAMGIGRPSETLLGLRQSYQEAAQAMALEYKLWKRCPLYFGDLGIYRLLLKLEHSPELLAFWVEMIGSLVEYDRAQGGSLVATLKAYFQHNGNLVQTAQSLSVHRNTLLYRLNRASQIGKFDLDNPQTRLALQLALHAYDLGVGNADWRPPL